MDVRNLDGLKIDALITTINAMRFDAATASKPHLDEVPVVTLVGTAADLPAAIIKVNSFVSTYATHIASAATVSTKGAHLTADATNVVTAPTATDQSTANARANDLKAQFNAHVASTTFHKVADAGVITASNATNLASLQTLLLDIASKMDAHFARCTAASFINVVPA